METIEVPYEFMDLLGEGLYAGNQIVTDSYGKVWKYVKVYNPKYAPDNGEDRFIFLEIPRRKPNYNAIYD